MFRSLFLCLLFVLCTLSKPLNLHHLDNGVLPGPYGQMTPFARHNGLDFGGQSHMQFPTANGIQYHG